MSWCVSSPPSSAGVTFADHRTATTITGVSFANSDKQDLIVSAGEGVFINPDLPAGRCTTYRRRGRARRSWGTCVRRLQYRPHRTAAVLGSGLPNCWLPQGRELTLPLPNPFPISSLPLYMHEDDFAVVGASSWSLSEKTHCDMIILPAACSIFKLQIMPMPVCVHHLDPMISRRRTEIVMF